jgi:hypothetical protein
LSFHVTDRPSRATPPLSRAGYLRRENRHEVPFGIPRSERLVKDARRVQVLLADGEVRVEQRRRLPPEHSQQAAATALGRLVGREGLRCRDAGPGEHLGRHWRGEPDVQHHLDEPAARKRSALDSIDQAAQVLLVHASPSLSQSRVAGD